MSDAWFAEKLAPDGDAEDGCHPQEVQALKQYLCKEISAREAARAITQPASENPAERLQPFWGFLVDALVELPSEHTSTLIELLRAIEYLPSPDTMPERLWRGLPGFAHEYANAHQ